MGIALAVTLASPVMVPAWLMKSALWVLCIAPHYVTSSHWSVIVVHGTDDRFWALTLWPTLAIAVGFAWILWHAPIGAIPANSWWLIYALVWSMVPGMTLTLASLTHQINDNGRELRAALADDQQSCKHCSYCLRIVVGIKVFFIWSLIFLVEQLGLLHHIYTASVADQVGIDWLPILWFS